MPATELAGLSGARVHDLRHTCASQLIAEGSSPKLVQTWLGHSDIGVTLNTYTHLFDHDLRRMADRLDSGATINSLSST